MTEHPGRSPEGPQDPSGHEWGVLELRVDEPPAGPVSTEEDRPRPSADDAPPGPPGGRTFSLEGRPTPGLYLIGWLGTVGGLAIIAVALLSGSPGVAPLIALIGILVLGIGLSVAAGYQLVARSGRPAYAYRGPSPLIVFGVVLCLSTALSAVLGLAGIRSDQPAGFLVALGVVALAYVLLVGLFVVRSGALRPSEMGWPGWPVGARYGLGRALADVAYAAALIVPTLLAALLLAGLLSQLLGVLPTQILPIADTPTDRLLVLLAAALLAPIGEELFFRGFALTAWLRDLGPKRALVRASLFFAIVHIANVNVEPGQAGTGFAQALIQFAVILPVGTVLGVLFLQRGMVAAIAGHMTYNGIGLALYFVGRSIAQAS